MREDETIRADTGKHQAQLGAGKLPEERQDRRQATTACPEVAPSWVAQ
jgi:hypothetical protein